MLRILLSCVDSYCSCKTFLFLCVIQSFFSTCTCIFFYYYWGGTYVTRYCGHFWPIVQPQIIDESDCGAIGGMKIVRGNRSTWRKPAPAPFCPPQIPLDQTRARTRAAVVGSQRLTAWAMARLYLHFRKKIYKNAVELMICNLIFENRFPQFIF
jgi:hypothetical protein